MHSSHILNYQAVRKAKFLSQHEAPTSTSTSTSAGEVKLNHELRNALVHYAAQKDAQPRLQKVGIVAISSSIMQHILSWCTCCCALQMASDILVSGKLNKLVLKLTERFIEIVGSIPRCVSVCSNSVFCMLEIG